MKFGIAALLLFSFAAVSAQQPNPVLTPAESDPKAEEVREFHENGQLSKLFFRRDGQADGFWQEWDEEGRPRYFGEWSNGKGEGLWLYFHPNGVVRERSHVLDDIWHGVTEGWHPNGQKAFDGIFTNGVRLNIFRYWNETGLPAGPWAEVGLAQSPDGAEPRKIAFGEWPEDFAKWDFSLTPDLQTMFIATGDEDGANRRILQRRWQNGKWLELEPAAFGNTSAAEGTPIASYDGEWVYFSSDRHKAAEPDNTLRDIYRASRSSGWKEVQRVTQTPAYGEISLSYALNGRGVMWTDRRMDGSRQMGLYEVRLSESGPADPPQIEVVSGLNDFHENDPSNENYAAISPDGATLVFANYDIGGGGTDEDLYLSRTSATGWTRPVSLGPLVNTAGFESNPLFVGDGKVLLFQRAVGDMREIYSVPIE
jgi:antitoxin component YwqK of YwqJK toxin-antitoxin module